MLEAEKRVLGKVLNSRVSLSTADRQTIVGRARNRAVRFEAVGSSLKGCDRKQSSIATADRAVITPNRSLRHWGS